MAAGDEVFIPRVRTTNTGDIDAQELNDVFRQIFERHYALEGRTDESTIRDNLTVMGSVTLDGMEEPDLPSSSSGTIYYDSSSETFKVSEGGGAFGDLVATPLNLVGTANEVTVAEAGSTVTFSLPDDVALGLASPATGATTGFAYLGAIAGVPTGSPTSITGFRPLGLDSTGLTLFAHSGTNWVGLYDRTIHSAGLFSDQNDYNPEGSGDHFAYHWRLTPALGARTLTGIAAKTGGQEIIITNVAPAQNLLLAHQDTNSSEANRMICPGAATLTLTPSTAALLWYDSVTARWRVFAL